jgi:hypothetical protein
VHRILKNLPAAAAALQRETGVVYYCITLPRRHNRYYRILITFYSSNIFSIIYSFLPFVMNALELAVYKFRGSFERLKQWPDKAVIVETTRIAEHHIEFAFHFVSVIISRLTNPSLDGAFKLPILYLMDSIMKNVGGPYAALFSKHLYDIQSYIFLNVNEVDRGKIIFLLGTWEERNLLSKDLLWSIKSRLTSQVRFFSLRII